MQGRRKAHLRDAEIHLPVPVAGPGHSKLLEQFRGSAPDSLAA